MHVTDASRPTAEAQPLSHGIIVETVAFDAPWVWLAGGWRDFWAAPVVSFFYGSIFASLAALLTAGLLARGLESLILPLSGGFLLVGPALAVGLYETSRRLEANETVRLVDILQAVLRCCGRLSFFGAMLGFVYVIWLQLAFLLLMLFLGSNHLPPARDFVAMLLFTPMGLGLLVAGTLVGGALGLLVFSISVVSVPLLMTRRIDAVTAVATSLSAVLRNPKPMLLWAALIAGFMSLGLATVFVGLVVSVSLDRLRDLARVPRCHSRASL
ncbi:MAG: DUF2189 domain-containing protein [Sphingomonadales bacterium]|nr:DUF2189 domain-containing protein [Sphingomonadales bacterium]